MGNQLVQPALSIPRGRFRIAIAQALFNVDITNSQLAEAKRCAEEHGVAYDVFTTMGSYELPQLLDRLAENGKAYDGFVALGCLIKGDTIHFEVIADAVAHGLLSLSLARHIPVGFGVMTAFTAQQAQERTQIGYGATYAVLHTLSQTLQR
jgi:6,7-dimethyl-8-ribityllumazine synthase